jgi:uncharacterized protein YdeI (YjbR/CyaY-like superfamily)
VAPCRPRHPLAFESAAALDAWLTAHPAPRPGLWIRVAKKGSGIPSVTAVEVNDIALRHGWITGRRKGLDASCYLQTITPRRPGSLWSMVNVRRVDELTGAGRMRPAGLGPVAKIPPAPRRPARTLAAPGTSPSTSSTRTCPRHAESTHRTPQGPPFGRTTGLSQQAPAEVEAAKADGRWAAAYESQRDAVVPEDLDAALQGNPRARAVFEGLGKTDRYQVMLGILRSRTPKSRAARLAAAIAKLERAAGPR